MTKVIGMRSEDTSDRSGDNEDPIPVLIGVVGLLAVFVGVNTGISIEQALMAGGAVLLLGAILIFGLQKYGEAIVQYFLATSHLLLATKWANRQYRLKNPWRQPLPDAGRARLSAHGKQAGKIVQTGLTRVKSHPSTPFEQPDDQSSEKKQLEAPDDE